MIVPGCTWPPGCKNVSSPKRQNASPGMSWRFAITILVSKREPNRPHFWRAGRNHIRVTCCEAMGENPHPKQILLHRVCSGTQSSRWEGTLGVEPPQFDLDRRRLTVGGVLAHLPSAELHATYGARGNTGLRPARGLREMMISRWQWGQFMPMPSRPGRRQPSPATAPPAWR